MHDETKNVSCFFQDHLTEVQVKILFRVEIKEGRCHLPTHSFKSNCGVQFRNNVSVGLNLTLYYCRLNRGLNCLGFRNLMDTICWTEQTRGDHSVLWSVTSTVFCVVVLKDYCFKIKHEISRVRGFLIRLVSVKMLTIYIYRERERKEIRERDLLQVSIVFSWSWKFPSQLLRINKWLIFEHIFFFMGSH